MAEPRTEGEYPSAQREGSPASPFAGRAPIDVGSDGALTIVPRPSVERIVLRGDAGRPRFADAVAHALGVALPRSTGAVGAGAAICVLCLAPDEWLVVGEPGTALRAAALRDALAGECCAIVDAGSALATLRVGGARAPALLRKVCSVDVGRMTGRDCWQTRLGPYAVLVHRRGPFAYDLGVARSYALSFFDWLADAAVEFGAPG